MNTIILIVNDDTPWTPEYWIQEQGGKINASNPFVLSRGDQWISISKDPSVLDDYSASEISEIIKFIDPPRFYVIEWNAGKLVDEFLNAIPSDLAALIDNDHGLISQVNQLSGKPISTWSNRTTEN